MCSFNCDLCCVHGQNLPACEGCSHPSCSSPSDPSSLPCLGAGPLGMAQGIPGYGEQVCLSAPAGQCGLSRAASQAERQVSVGGSFFWHVVGRVSAELWSTGCSARLVDLCGSDSFFQSSKWHWPVCSCAQMGMAFQELRLPMERTTVLGYLAPS